jgi:hypothetical protein
MCFSAQISLATLGLGLGCSGLVALLPKPEDKVIGGFLAYVSLMQLVEYGLWKHPFCDATNKALTKLGLVLNHSQPLFLVALSALYFPANKTILAWIGIVYTVAMVAYTSQWNTLLPQSKCTLKDHSSTHLRWNWNLLSLHPFFYILFLGVLLLVPLVAFSDSSIGVTMAVTCIVSWTTSALLYPSQVVGALWCFFTVFIPGLYYWARLTNLL